VVVEPPPPQPLIAAPIIASNNTDAANAGLAAQARASVRLRRRSHRNISSVGRTQRIGKRFQGVLSREEGAGGVSNAFAVVITLIATVAGAACVTVTGEAGPLHMALGGAPVQLTVTMS
jgi:hypothetical protein